MVVWNLDFQIAGPVHVSMSLTWFALPGAEHKQPADFLIMRLCDFSSQVGYITQNQPSAQFWTCSKSQINRP
jgi:hypothetical protein